MASDWRSIKLEDAAQFFSGGTPPKINSKFWGGDIPWISAKSMSGSRYHDSELKLTKCGLEKGSRLAPKDSVLLLVRGSMLHQRIPVGITTKPVAFNQDVKAIVPNKDFLPLYFYYCFAGREQEFLAKVENTGIGAGKLDTEVLKKIEFYCPPMIEQKAIARVLGALDDKIELNRQMNLTLESMAQALFKSWFVDFDPVIDNALAAGNPIPDALKAKAAQRFEQLKAATQSGTLLAANRELFPSEFAFTEELGWIPKGWTVGAVKEVVKRLKINKTYTKKDVLDHGAVPVYEQGAKILLGYHNNEPNIKASINNPAFIFGDHTCINKLSLEPFSTSSNVITLIGKIYPTVWVYYAVKDKQSFEEYRRHWMEFIIKPVILPSLELTELFSEYTTSFQVKQMKIQNQNSDLAKLRDTLLPKLLSGELRIADAAALVEGV